MKYPAHFEPDYKLGGYVVTFRDIPEAITQGETVSEALIMAQDVLISAMDFYFEDMRTIPMPSETLADEHCIEIPETLAQKIRWFNESLHQ